MSPVDHFKHCPRCGVPRTGEPVIPFHCGTCEFTFYFNPTVAAAVLIVRQDGCVLCITRAQDPAQGKLAFPGGFSDIGERAEDGLRREVREEVGLEIGALEFLCSRPNEYFYKEITYPVLDLLFTAPAIGETEARALDGVSRVDWLKAAAIAPDELAFPSLRAGLAEFLRRGGGS